MRAWRTLKAAGSAVLRDGVYLLPDHPSCRETLAAVERNILDSDGYACLLPVSDPHGERFIPLFSRAKEYSELRSETEEQLALLDADTALAVMRQARKLRKTFSHIHDIDFFPDATQQQADSRLRELETAISRALSRDEPSGHEQAIERLPVAAFKERVWATRQRPWVDRLASAWLIKRFIDPAARILWLQSPSDCPDDALGFDFDGARFSHVGNRVTFETLQASFALDAPGLTRMAALVHYLDIGGAQPAEAAGVERVLAGLHTSIGNDDQLLNAACAIFDGLLAAFGTEGPNDE
ncbi:chromate resistance protein [Pseudomonas stutzeri]|uniref:Chromate resistance protein n=2 Tax=Stutzerimonas stutzeri TaxID=316 RepID=A0A2N8S692_STUST|nr:chromate resistance protein [Stutzerimonas stutzeri]PNF82146.1 chromate resistance protein [Stutzerimonas stutzeri]